MASTRTLLGHKSPGLPTRMLLTGRSFDDIWVSITYVDTETTEFIRNSKNCCATLPYKGDLRRR